MVAARKRVSASWRWTTSAGSRLFWIFCFIAPAIAQQPGIHTKYEGLRADDEFDVVLSKAFGCPEEAFKSMIAEVNKRRTDGKLTRVRDCIFEAALAELIERESGTPAAAIDYITSRGGNCSASNGGWDCILTRKVTRTAYVGTTPGGTLVDLFTVKISLSNSKEPVRVKLIREGVGR